MAKFPPHYPPVAQVYVHLEQSLPVVRRPGEVTTKAQALALWGKYPSKRKKRPHGETEEFAVSPLYAPVLVEQLAPLGAFPMTLPLDAGLVRSPAFKLHNHRALAYVGDGSPAKMHPDQPTLRGLRECRPMCGVGKLAKSHHVVVDAHWADVCDMIQQQHGTDWLNAELRNVFTFMFLHPERNPGVRLHCIAIIESTPSPTRATRQFAATETSSRPKGTPVTVTASAEPSGPRLGRVVAGEIGYAFGAVYSSLTGAYAVDGVGTLQLAALQALLRLSGFLVWDLGMSMPYKEKALGTQNLPRRAWMDLCEAARARPRTLDVGATAAWSLLHPTSTATTTADRTSSGGADGASASLPSSSRLITGSGAWVASAAPVPCSLVIDAFRQLHLASSSKASA